MSRRRSLNQSLERLGRLLASTGTFGNRYLNQRFEQLMATMARLAPDGQYRPDSLLHLIGILRRDADLLVSIGGNRLHESRNGQDTMLAKGVAGLLWAWIQPEGLLTSWYEELHPARRTRHPDHRRAPAAGGD